VDTKYYRYKGKDIEIYQISESTSRYNTPNFEKVQDIKKKNNVKTKTWKDALDWFFLVDEKIPINAKLSTDRIGVNEAINTFCFEMEISRSVYRNLEYIAKNTGWYFYLTGIKLGTSNLCKAVDDIPRRFKLDDIKKWEIEEDDSIELINISTLPNSTCFLLQIGDYDILLDVGLSKKNFSNDFNNVLKFTSKIDAIFLSHAHFDHYCGLDDIITKFPDAILLCSKTTLDFYAYRYAKKNWIKFNEFKIELFDITKKIIENSVNICSGEEITLKSGKLRFYFAGHMPGALMINCKIGNYNFLYTGDFSYFGYYPIAGAKNLVDMLQEPINYLLLDASMCEKTYNAPNYINSSLNHSLRLKAGYGNQTLIAADTASTGLVLYITIFNYFRNLQLKKNFNNRPTIIMGRESLEYAKVVQFRTEDIHPKIRNKIERQLNPFTSALTHFCKNFSEIAFFLDKRNCIFIFGNGDISYGMSKYLVTKIGNKERNLICLTGALRSEISIELASGSNEIIIDNRKFINKADIYNFKFPKNTFNFHADSIQINKLIDDMKPKNVGLFHNTSRKMVAIRADILKKDFVEETHSFDEKIKIVKLK